MNIADLFQRALHFHQSGQLRLAEPLYRQILQQDPRHAEAHHLLGLLANQAGHPVAAVGLLRQAIALNPAADVAYFNLGVALMNCRQFAEAATCFRHFLKVNPDHVDAHVNLGGALQAQGQVDEAASCYRLALRLGPPCAMAFYNLGNILRDQKQLAEANACFRQVLLLDPQHADSHTRLGNTLWEQGQLDEAIACYRQALRINPEHPDASYNLGNALGEKGQLAEAVPCYQQTLRGNALHADARGNLARALMRLGRLPEAVQENDEVLRLHPADKNALFRRALLNLVQGDFENGWRDHEHRLTMPNIPPCPSNRPIWDGSPLEGKTILVYAEQGFGDTIQFIRYFPWVKRQGGTVLFLCEPSLIPLLAGFPGVDHVVAKGSMPPPHDAQAALLSLPRIFKTTLTSIPANVPYLAADPKRIEYWRQELTRGAVRPGSAGRPADDIKIGIVWQGNPSFVGYDQFRSIPLKHFEALADVPGVRLVSLQKGPGTRQLASWQGRTPIFDLGERLDAEASFLDSAALMMSLDLVVAIDTSLAHLAGALAVPVWVPLPSAPDWRWLLNRSDSPWYPSVRLFRQKSLGNWAEVFEQMAEALRSMDRRVLRQENRNDLDPAAESVLFDQGIVFMNSNQFAEAVACFRQVLQLNPNQMKAHVNLGAALQRQGRLDEATTCYRQALRLDPTCARAFYNLGNVLRDQKQLAEARACFRQVLLLDPQHADSHTRLGNLLWDQGHLDEAITCYRQALASNPAHPDATYNLGNALADQGRLAEAVPCYEQTLRGNPSHADARGNLATALMRLGRLPEAVQQNEELLRQHPTDRNALFRRSLLCLLQGDFESGWRDYEQRLAMPNIPPRLSPRPLWDGSCLKGKTILVYAEQGFGDTLQFIRYLPLVKKCGGTVVFECEPALMDLMAGFPGVDRFIAMGTDLCPHDVQAALLSLPGIFKTTVATIPAAVPYLTADPQRVLHWHHELRRAARRKPAGEVAEPPAVKPATTLNVGIVWQGNPAFGGDQFRSIPLTCFEPLARVPGVTLVSLQKGPGVSQLRTFAERYPVVDLSEQLATFSDTAAVIMNLDLIVSSCTSVPHLAGALGVPVWVALQITPDWRWFLDRVDSPWYPTMRLFRQARFGEWEQVFERMAEELKKRSPRRVGQAYPR